MARSPSVEGPPSATTPNQSEQVFVGLGVSPGVAVGPVYLRHADGFDITPRSLPKANIDGEVGRFHQAVKSAQRQVRRLRAKSHSLTGSAAEELGYLFDAYDHMLQDSRLVRGVERRIREERMNPEWALQEELDELRKTFEAMDDPYFVARLEDIRDVAHRLMAGLTQGRKAPPPKIPPGSVLMAEELGPSDAALLDPSMIGGFATVLGGAEGHTAIIARALGIPAVMGVPQLFNRLATGEVVVVDGDAGVVIVNPTPGTLSKAEARRSERQRETKRLLRQRTLPSRTRDGQDVTLMANVELPLEMSAVESAGAQGIGLLRSEFMFMNRDDLPSEAEQYQLLNDMAEKLDGAPLTVRTLDVGGEKIASAVAEQMGSTASSPLGLRGVRLSLVRRDLLEAQFAAILRVAAKHPLRILLPMVTTPREMRKAREILKTVAKRLRRRRLPVPDPLPPLGAMIEVPAAALSADALANACDFFAVGSNDLTMYTLAIDRSDDSVAPLYDPQQPAVLRLIQFTAVAALRARIGLSICGEMAGDPRYTAFLLGLGFRELSMSPPNIPRVKQRIRELDMTAATAHATQIMEQWDAGRIAMMIDDFIGLSEF